MILKACVLFCHLAFALLNLSIRGSWWACGVLCQPCNEDPSGLDPSCTDVYCRCTDEEGQPNEGPGSELFVHNLITLSSIWLHLYAQRAQLRFLLSGKDIVRRAACSDTFINPTTWTYVSVSYYATRCTLWSLSACCNHFCFDIPSEFDHNALKSKTEMSKICLI